MSVWYAENSADGIAVSSRIRLARNIESLPFSNKMTAEQRIRLNETVRDAIINSNTPFSKSLKFILMRDIPENERLAMVERHIVSPAFVSNCENKAIILSEDETVSVMIGEEDHLRIQVIMSGLQLEKAYDIADSIDNLLLDSLKIAFSSKLGFLTSCPTNLGTGLRASVMLHLPVTESLGEISSLSESISKIGFTVRGMYGEGSKAHASLYQLSNQITLGISEKNAIDNLKIITNQLINKEKENLEKINRLDAEDISLRALGTLKYAKKVSSDEMMKLLSRVKLGINLGVINKDINPVKLLIEGKPYMLMKKYGVMSPDERDIYRANMIRKELEEN